VTGILAVGRHGTYTAPGSTAAERDAARSSGRALAIVTDVALAGGLAAGGFTAYWYLVKYRPAQGKRAEQPPAATAAVRGRRDPAQSTKLDLIPWVQSDASGLTLVGVF
jgi:Na+/glutamate symporter